MPAPFRIRRPMIEGLQKTTAKGASADSIGHWLDRLVRLVPSEVIAVYLTGKGYATNWPGIWSFVCLGLVVVIRVWGTKEPGTRVQWIAVAVSAVSFVIWVYAIGGRFLAIVLPDPGIAPAAVLVWTVVVPIIYKGD